ncbi:hypothetical protein F5Y09DRAFT_268867 [Xylaria sp. FL1042]|nr:hypothetical protein F5Y09DRAFT_268867 [Xylaria sp. FL1042]
MSASAPPIPSADITYITSEPFVPKPLIADILRTRFCVPDSIFLVEGVDVVHTSKSKRWRAIRLLLGDGELCIQALMSAETHRFVDRGEVSFGSYVKLQKFRVEWKDIAKGDSASSGTSEDTGDSNGEKKGQMVYLIVESLVVVGWNNTLIDTDTFMANEEEIDLDPVEAESKESEDSQNQPPLLEPEKGPTPNQAAVANSEPEVDSASVDMDDDFEIMALSKTETTHNREEAATATAAAATTTTTTTTTTPEHNTTIPSNPPHDLTRPLKLTKLRSIPNLPYKQNWSVNVLCIISAISDIEPAGIPPYTQRQARLSDPSTDKHVLLTVFLDPHLFTPQVGSVVLLRGVKNHRFDGGCLKKYASDRPRDGGSWWCENPDPVRFSWCDVEGLRRWWGVVGTQGRCVE